MQTRQFRKNLSNISNDLNHGHLSINEALIKLKEFLEPLFTGKQAKMPTDQEVAEWYDINIGNDPDNPCSASSGIYKFRQWLVERWLKSVTKKPTKDDKKWAEDQIKARSNQAKISDEEIRSEIYDLTAPVCFSGHLDSRVKSHELIDLIAKWAIDRLRDQLRPILTEISEQEYDEIMQQLLNRWGFSEGGDINVGSQLKIFSFMDWFKDKWLKDQMRAKETGEGECEHDFNFYYANTPTDKDLYRCKKCGKIEYEHPSKKKEKEEKPVCTTPDCNCLERAEEKEEGGVKSYPCLKAGAIKKWEIENGEF